MRKVPLEVTVVDKDSPGLRGRLLNGLGQGASSVIAALLAYLPSQALESKEAFWGAITAISVVQTQFKATQTMAREQFTGAAVGGVIALCFVLGLGQRLWVYVLAVVLSMLVCWAANVAGASRLAGVTATIILLVPHTGSVESMALWRMAEVAWGVCVAVATAWSVARLSTALGRERRHLHHD